MEYATQIAPVSILGVAGDTRGHDRRSNQSRRCIDALIKWFCRLHSLGYALDGIISKDLFGIDYMGSLRGMASLLPSVKLISDIVDGVENNMAVVAGIIENGIHANLRIPQDLAHLIHGLKNYNIGYSPLVQSHICHEEEDMKTAIFARMYKRLRVIEKMDPNTYANIVQAMQARLAMQPPAASLWLLGAMPNTHLHCVLRYTPWDRKLTRDIYNIVDVFMRTKVQYADDLDGWLTCRRNSEAHMEADNSVDTIGYLEAAIFGAAAGLRTWHYLKYNAAVAGAVQLVEPLATRLLKPIPRSISKVVADAIAQFLCAGAPMSLEAAKAGAAEAAMYLVRQPEPSLKNRFKANVFIQNALARASAAAKAVGGVAQVPPPLQMFTADDIDRIFHIVAPRLVAVFQLEMFKAQESFRLGSDTRVPRLD